MTVPVIKHTTSPLFVTTKSTKHRHGSGSSSTSSPSPSRLSLLFFGSILSFFCLMILFVIPMTHNIIPTETTATNTKQQSTVRISNRDFQFVKRRQTVNDGDDDDNDDNNNNSNDAMNKQQPPNTIRLKNNNQQQQANRFEQRQIRYEARRERLIAMNADLREEQHQHLRPHSTRQFSTQINITYIPPPIYHPKTTHSRSSNHRPGVIILGMHRSGTSLLAGLLVNGTGYHAASNPEKDLMPPRPDNTKGFFERLDVAAQNDAFMKSQHVKWFANVVKYDADVTLRMLEQQRQSQNQSRDDDDDTDATTVVQQRGREPRAIRIPTHKMIDALTFFNNSTNIPWMMKDPRLCITLKTWLNYINGTPAVVFTYRHPLEVAASLIKRDMGVTTFEHGLMLWKAYNMMAVVNSRGLCRVVSSKEAIYDDTLREVRRIVRELEVKCRVPRGRRVLSQSDVDMFVDPEMAHYKEKHASDANGGAGGGDGEETTTEVLARHGDCIVYAYNKTHWLQGMKRHRTAWRIPRRKAVPYKKIMDLRRQRRRRLLFEADNKEMSAYEQRERREYLKAMKIFCDMKSGEAFKEDYVFDL